MSCCPRRERSKLIKIKLNHKYIYKKEKKHLEPLHLHQGCKILIPWYVNDKNMFSLHWDQHQITSRDRHATLEVFTGSLTPSNQDLTPEPE